MKINDHKNLFNWIGAIAVSAPVIAWLFVFYSNTVVMASNIEDLQKERTYIRSSLEKILVQLSKIDGTLEEHLINDRPIGNCKK